MTEDMIVPHLKVKVNAVNIHKILISDSPVYRNVKDTRAFTPEHFLEFLEVKKVVKQYNVFTWYSEPHFNDVPSFYKKNCFQEWHSSFIGYITQI